MREVPKRQIAVAATAALALACGQVGRTSSNTREIEAGRSDAQSAPGASLPDARRGDASAGGDGPPDVTTTADSGESAPGVLIYDGAHLRLDVVSDREGNALIKWDAGEQVHFARWQASTKQWLSPSPVRLDGATIVDTHASGYPILIGDTLDPVDGGDHPTVVRRFDPETNEWGPPHVTKIPGTFVHLFHMSMDGVGNVYAYWSGVVEFTIEWSWWPVDSLAWAPTAILDRVSGIRGARTSGAWLWQEQSGVAVRQFNLGTASWTDEFELVPLAPAFDTHTFAVGPSGEALMATLRRETTELVVDVRRYDSMTETWGANETALSVPLDTDPNVLWGPLYLHTDARYQDVIASPLPGADGFDVHVSRRDAATGVWSTSRIFPGLLSSNSMKLVADDAGNLYGYVPPGTLVHYGSSTGEWTDTQVGASAFRFAVLPSGVFALGWNEMSELVAYRHPGGDGTWRLAQGLPSQAVPDIGSVPFDIAPLGLDRALAVWSARSGNAVSVRAAFIE